MSRFLASQLNFSFIAGIYQNADITGFGCGINFAQRLTVTIFNDLSISSPIYLESLSYRKEL